MGIGTPTPEGPLHVKTEFQKNAFSDGIGFLKGTSGNDYQLQINAVGGVPHIDFANEAEQDASARIALYNDHILDFRGKDFYPVAQIRGGNDQVDIDRLLQMQPQNETNEGGHINFAGAGNFQDWAVDTYEGDFRIFTPLQSREDDSEKGQIGLWGDVGIGTTSPSKSLDVYNYSFAVGSNSDDLGKIFTSYGDAGGATASAVLTLAEYDDPVILRGRQTDNKDENDAILSFLDGKIGVATIWPDSKLTIGNRESVWSDSEGEFLLVNGTYQNYEAGDVQKSRVPILSANSEWNQGPKDIISLGYGGTTTDMFTKLSAWSRYPTENNIDTANYIAVGENGTTFTPGSIRANDFLKSDGQPVIISNENDKDVRLCAGHTPIGSSDWQTYHTDEIYIDVDTSHCNFTQTPIYISNLAGESSNWRTTGGSSPYKRTNNSFRIYLDITGPEAGRALSKSFANDRDWHITWMAVGR